MPDVREHFEARPRERLVEGHGHGRRRTEIVLAANDERPCPDVGGDRAPVYPFTRRGLNESESSRAGQLACGGEFETLGWQQRRGGPAIAVRGARIS